MGSLSVWIDESGKGDMLVVAGVLCDWDAVPGIVNEWRNVKTAVGLPREVEVKWNVPERHSTREALTRVQRTSKELREQAVKFVTGRYDLTFIAVVMLEYRDLSFWRDRVWRKASVQDFYCEGLKYLVQRVAQEVVEARFQSCAIICDTPELGRESFTFRAIRRGSTAVEKTYQDWYRSGAGRGPGGQHKVVPLCEIGFHPSVLIRDATYYDMLQIADVEAGVTREWVGAARENRETSWKVECFKAISGRFRSRHGTPGLFGDGFVLWPSNPGLWEQLKRSLGYVMER
jgi:hypothetical protein